MTFTFTFAFINNCPDITRSVTLIQILHDYVSQKLEKKWLPQYLTSEEFAKARAEDEAANQFDAADEAERRRNQRMQKMMQLLEKRWVTSSEDILAFRRCLLDAAGWLPRLLS